MDNWTAFYDVYFANLRTNYCVLGKMCSLHVCTYCMVVFKPADNPRTEVLIKCVKESKEQEEFLHCMKILNPNEQHYDYYKK